jgi:hypothetical protein
MMTNEYPQAITTISTYPLKAVNGRVIRQATVIVIHGHVIHFTERMSNKQAVVQALALIAKGYEED